MTLIEVTAKLIVHWVLQTVKCILLAAQSLNNQWGKIYFLVAKSLHYPSFLLFDADVRGKVCFLLSGSSVTADGHLVLIKTHRCTGHRPSSPIPHFLSLFSSSALCGVLPMKTGCFQSAGCFPKERLWPLRVICTHNTWLLALKWWQE